MLDTRSLQPGQKVLLFEVSIKCLTVRCVTRTNKVSRKICQSLYSGNKMRKTTDIRTDNAADSCRIQAYLPLRQQ